MYAYRLNVKKLVIYLFIQLQSKQLNIYLKTVFIYLIWACTVLFTLDGGKLSQWNLPLKSNFFFFYDFPCFLSFFKCYLPFLVFLLFPLFFSLSLVHSPAGMT